MASLPNSQLFSSTRYTRASVGTCAKWKIANIANVNGSRHGSSVHLPTRQQFSNVHLAMGLCHTAAILSRETKVALFYLSSLALPRFHCEVEGGKTKLFSVSRNNMAAVWIRPIDSICECQSSLRIQPYLLVPHRWVRFADRTSAPQTPKFHTDHAKQWLRNKSDSRWIKINIWNFCQWSTDVSPAKRSSRWRLYSQASSKPNWKILLLNCFIFLFLRR